MPKVDGKHFPYTKEGKEMAKEATKMMKQKRLLKKKRIMTDGGYMPMREK